MARPHAFRVQRSPLTAGGVGRHAHMPPEPGVSTEGLAKIAPGFGRAMRAPTAGALGEGAFDAAVRRGRPYRPPLRTRLRLPRKGGLYGRPEPVSNSYRGSMVPFAIGARMARPHAFRVQRSPLTAGGVGRHAHMPPEPGVSTEGLAKIAPGFGRAMRAPTAGALGEGAFDAAVRRGRPYRPPLQPRLRFPRRGGVYPRPYLVPFFTGPWWLRRLGHGGKREKGIGNRE